MGVLRPALTFTIPSINDSLSLDCRIYRPSNYKTTTVWKNTAVILAHPYAPLGGDYDAPVIHFATAALLKEGVTVGTFNFRGASGSKGRTTWTGKGEIADYESFAGFVAFYLQFLQPSQRHKESNEQALSEGDDSPRNDQKGENETARSPIHLVLGGYSYGSQVVTRLPPFPEVLQRFCSAKEESAAAEIIKKARELAMDTLTDLAQKQETPQSPHALRVGEATSPHRSTDILHHIPKAVKALSGKHSSQTTVAEPPTESLFDAPSALCYYLLISPLLPPTSNLVMLPLGHGHGIHDRPAWTMRPAFAIFGDEDFFTSFKKLTAWAQKMSEEENTQFKYAAISEAGHFWVEDGVERRMKDALRLWLRTQILPTVASALP